MEDSSEKLQALKAKIDAGENPEFDNSPVIQVKDALKHVSLLITEPRSVQNIENELQEFDRWLKNLKTAADQKLFTTIPADPYSSETGETQPFLGYSFRHIRPHGHHLWDTIAKQFGFILPDGLTLTQFMQQFDRNEQRQGRIPKKLTDYNRVQLTFRTKLPGVAFDFNHFVPHPEKPHVLPLDNLGTQSATILFKKQLLSKYLPPTKR